MTSLQQQFAEQDRATVDAYKRQPPAARSIADPFGTMVDSRLRPLLAEMAALSLSATISQLKIELEALGESRERADMLARNYVPGKGGLQYTML